MKNVILFGLLAAITMGTSGCALTSKSDIMAVRWFNPEAPKTTTTSAGASPANSSVSLELGRVSSGINLRDKIAYRDTAYEMGFYDDKRWTERPEVYVRRELARTLFEEHGVHRALAGQAPTLDVEVLAFEEIRGDAPAARVTLRIVLHDDVRAILEKTITVDRPAASKNIDGFVQAMAQALDTAAEQVAHEAEIASAKP